MESNTDSDYDSSQIRVLEGLEGVKERPGMYIGNTDERGLHHLVHEVVDNSIDEAMIGECDEIDVTLREDGGVTVEDNGRGIPVETNGDNDGISTLTLIMTELHAGGKFDNAAYEQSGGLHGVGVSVVNALSRRLVAEVKRDGYVWKQSFENGKPVSNVEKVREKREEESTGTRITFWPIKEKENGEELFETVEFSFDQLKNRFRELAFLNPEIAITITDEKNNVSSEFKYDGGIREFVEFLNEEKNTLHSEPVYVSGEEDGIRVEIAMQATDSIQESIHSFVNNINTSEGGTHMTGLKTSLTRVVNSYADENNLLNGLESLNGSDIREGLTLVLSVKHPDPQFEGQTKKKLGNREVRGVVSGVVHDKLQTVFIEQPQIADSIVQKAVQAAKARQAAEKAKEVTRRDTALNTTTLPGKLADCQNTDPRESELVIVEGDSAGGCFTGDTEMALASGRSITFEELVEENQDGENHYCYTVDDGRIHLQEIANPRKTREDADLVQVTISNGETIECTPDHKFMLCDGEYREAQNLKNGDSLMPLYWRESDSDEEEITIDEHERVKTFIMNALEASESYNHSVESVETLNKTASVYDIEVPETHNFALDSGVFVHNSAKQGRDREFQAILPLSGKILNVEKNRQEKILQHEHISQIIEAIGAGVSSEFDIEKSRYGSIILCLDADSDGSHIRTLLLTFFYRYMRPLVENGCIYAAQPPLYRIKCGTETYDAMTENDRERIIEEKCNGSASNVQRFKGLGEMNPTQLWETTLNPENRRLKKITLEDTAMADKMFSVLMGEQVPPRKQFIKENANEVDWIDI